MADFRVVRVAGFALETVAYFQLESVADFTGIRINENQVTTLDFGQMAPRLMYGMAGVQPTFDDAYLLPGFGTKYRVGVKKVFNSLLCAEKRPARFPQGCRSLFPMSITINQVVEAILDAHAPIAHLFFSGHGLKVMFQESQVLISILMKLMEEEVVALPIHDALVVDYLHASYVREVMVSTFKDHTGGVIPVSTDDDDYHL